MGLKYLNIKLYPHHFQLFLLNHLFDNRDLKNWHDIRHTSSTTTNFLLNVKGC